MTWASAAVWPQSSARTGKTMIRKALLMVPLSGNASVSRVWKEREARKWEPHWLRRPLIGKEGVLAAVRLPGSLRLLGRRRRPCLLAAIFIGDQSRDVVVVAGGGSVGAELLAQHVDAVVRRVH